MATYEIEIRTSTQTLDIGSPGSPLNANLEVYNGQVGLIIPNDFTAEIPGGVINVGDSLIVRLVNDLPAPIATGIHWHGIELQNNADGTPVTQDGIPGGNLQFLGAIGGNPEPTEVGGTYLYKFKVTRPGIFWFHPHHFHSTNRVFRGSYGMLIVTDPNEAALIPATIPDASNTEQLVLSDITVCGNSGNNPGYDLTLPWAGPGGVLTAQAGFSPAEICDTNAVDEEGNGIPAPGYGSDDVPSIQRSNGRINEGLTVLTNGRNVGGRTGTPTSPDSIVPADVTMINVQPGQGLRLQIVNCATTRYFRLILTTNNGTQIPLVRIGGEGGVLDNAVLEGGTITGFDTKYAAGEILLPPATRADVVAAIPDDATTDLTLWTQDFERLSGQGGWANLPTVPVLHLNVTGGAVSPVFSIIGTANGEGAATQLRASTGDLVETLGASTANLQNPDSFSPIKDGMVNEEIQLTRFGPGPSINDVSGDFGGFTPYSDADHLGSSRYAKEGDLLHLTVANNTSAHHPFHLHGFSFQPVSITGPGGTLSWGYQEFRDTLDVPDGHTLAFKVQIEDGRVFADDVTTGGSLGRWLFHCHVFFHAHRGMISELVITEPDNDSGDEKPNIDVGGSWTYAPSGGIATRSGTYFLPDGDTVDTIVAHLENGTEIGDVTFSGTQWDWQSHTPPDSALSDQTSYVYVTITGNSGRKDQTIFRLQIGGDDDGSDNGDPHIRTIDGTNYDFQSVGEFTLLADRDGMEIQTRQTPVPTATPIKNSYTGLTSCVSVNTAVAARLGSHTISYQPSAEVGTLDFFVDGKQSRLTTRTLNLDNNLLRGIDVDGKMTLRIDYEHHAVLIVTPRFWGSNNIHYLNISISHTHGDEGLMGKIPAGSWLPRLRSGATLGPKPESTKERYTQLYQTFADSWRVTDRNSLFTYTQGTSTETFTDKDWPTIKPPCKLKPQFEIPGATPQAAIPEDEAKLICNAVTEDDLFENCVLDVAATGEKSFADGYLLAQRIRLCATSVQVIYEHKGGKITVTAIVLPLHRNGKKPTGKVTFSVNDVNVGQAVDVDSNGQASITLDRPKEGDKISAGYDGNDEDGLSSSGSPTLTYVVGEGQDTNEDNKGVPWYFWLILILLLLLIIFWFIF